MEHELPANRTAPSGRMSRAASFRGALRSNVGRADDFFARAAEFDAFVSLHTPQSGFGANAAVLWFVAAAGNMPTSISIAGVIAADMAIVAETIRLHNARAARADAAKRAA